MPWVYRPAICADVISKATQLLELLRSTVMRQAQRLKITQPEQLRVATMRDDVICYGRSDHLTLSLTHHAQWMRA
jgi:hypothetical protein